LVLSLQAFSSTDNRCATLGRYNVSKLVELLVFRELVETLTQPTNSCRIVTSIINPGAVATDVMREARGLLLLYTKIMRGLVMRTAEEGGRTLVHAAEGGRDTDKQYLCDCKPAGPEL
jgi:hypothetical protein